jgi:uncharacterized protein (DUF433 family)
MPTVLEDYFDFSEPEEIRIQGHRVWLHNVLYEYLYNQLTVEQLVDRFQTLNVEKVLACLLYYHRNKEMMDKHLTDYLEYCRVSEEQRRSENPERAAEWRHRKADWLARQKAAS